MNDITRIHLAKTPYDIEINAKKDLQKYLHSLETYAEGQDWFDDIEIRVTEILQERGVLANGVIGLEDVRAIKKQLGDTKDFAEGEVIDNASDDEPVHRLYRDTEAPLLGGVLSGIAKYFGIDSIWTRLGFIVFLIISFGTAAIVYAVLWAVIPPARTAAQKLQLSGKPVTLASIRRLSERTSVEIRRGNSAKVLNNIFVYGAGTLATIGAAVSIIVTIWGAIGLMLGTTDSSPLAGYIPRDWLSWVIYALFVLSGLLLTLLFSIVAGICFKKRATKQAGIAILVVIVSGIATFSTGMGLIAYSSWLENMRVQDSQFTKTINLANEFKQVTYLVVASQEDGAPTRVQYIVSTEAPHYEITLDASNSDMQPITKYSDDGKTVTLEMSGNSSRHPTFMYNAPLMTIYGPSLDSITSSAVGWSISYENKEVQKTISLIGDDHSSLSLTGTYSNVNATSKDGASLSLSQATIDDLLVNFQAGYVDAGVVRRLSVLQPNSCPADSLDNIVSVQAVSSQKLTYNGTVQAVRSIEGLCGNIVIGEERF